MVRFDCKQNVLLVNLLVCISAGLHALKRTLTDDLSWVAVSLTDVQSSLQVIKPSAMRQVAIDVPKVRTQGHTSTQGHT